jgi:hypothetical protein
VNLILALSLLTQATTTFDLSADFSLQTNPNKVWEYGYSETNSLDPAQFRIDRHMKMAGKIGFWHPQVTDRPGPGYYPYIAFNPTKESQYGSSNGWAVRPGEIAMEASNIGQYSLVRFIAPVAGIYKITARFAGVHFGISSTDVHVLHNAASLFDAYIERVWRRPRFPRCGRTEPDRHIFGPGRTEGQGYCHFCLRLWKKQDALR